MRRHGLVALIGLLVICSPARSVFAAECVRSCDAQVAACRLAECAGTRGVARRECAERCRGRFGCPTRIRTLAWVVTRCHTRNGRLLGSQELRIRRGDCDPITVQRFEYPGEVDDSFGLCDLLGRTRLGVGSGVAGVFQRLGVTPDGSGVVFEVSNAHQVGSRTPLTAEQQGFFYVGADGTGLRRLGPASRDPIYRLGISAGGGLTTSFNTHLSFSPSGRLVAYPDRGVAPDGSEQYQVFTLDVRDGARTQVTNLPAAPVDTSDPTSREVWNIFFVNDHTIAFATRVFDEFGGALYTIRSDGTGFRRNERVENVPLDVSRNPVPIFGVTGPGSRILSVFLRSKAVNTDPTTPDASVVEVFRVRGSQIMQLTAFRRFDTRSIGEEGGVWFAPRGPRVLFMASADPFGENPLANCQLFSMNLLGSGLRQLTHLDVGVRSVSGCYFGAYTGCAFYSLTEDPVTKWIVFYSNCDPFGANPNGSAVFAMRPDGRRLRQLTHDAGVRFGADGEVEVEIPGPIAYSTRFP
jgi:hypothetical protein